MNINSISPQNSVSAKGSSGSIEDPQIKNLEQKLIQLTKEKDKAKKAKDLDKMQEIEQKIQEIEHRLEELRRKNAKKENEESKEEASTAPPRIPKSDIGNYVDETV